MNKRVAVSLSDAGTGNTIAQAPTLSADSALNSLEQFITPVRIDKGHNGDITPCFQQPGVLGEQGNFSDGNAVSPSVHELDPYFPKIFAGDDGSGFISDCDYRLVWHEGTGDATTYDTNLNKFEGNGGDRSKIAAVQVMSALRGPLIMSGWGYGMDDLPEPSQGEKYPEKTKFSEYLKHNRGYWKTGPVHLMWDDERKVWAGGHRIVCGVAMTAITAPTDVCSPTTFTVRLFRNTGDDSKYSRYSEQEYVGPPGGGGGPPNPFPKSASKINTILCENITVNNRDPSLEQEYVKDAMFVIAIKLNYEWLPLWVGCPEEPAENAVCVTHCPGD